MTLSSSFSLHVWWLHNPLIFYVYFRLRLLVQFSSVAQSCLTLCNPMNCSMPGLPVHHQLLESTQTHVHWVSDATQPCHPLLLCLQSFPASGSVQMSQFFASGGQSIGASASVFPMNIQDWFPLGLTSWISLLPKGLSRIFSNTIRKHLQDLAFFMVQLSHLYMTLEKSQLCLYRLYQQSDVSDF